jgi:hypothetical protein
MEATPMEHRRNEMTDRILKALVTVAGIGMAVLTLCSLMSLLAAFGVNPFGINP